MPASESNQPLPLADQTGTTTWCSVADVQAITGETVQDADIQRAQFIIDIVTGRTAEQAELLDAWVHRRDLYYLRLATAFQTVWMNAQPDMYIRSDVSGVSQDGISSQLKPWAFKLAPLAKASLRRLSWKGSRSIKIGTENDLDLSMFENPNGPIVDQDGEQWSELGQIGDDDAKWGK